MLVALKLDDGIHDMFQYLRSCKRSLFINMSYQDNRNATGFGKSQQCCSTLSDLRDTARTAIHILCSDGLDGVDDHYFWSHLLDMGENLL